MHSFTFKSRPYPPESLNTLRRIGLYNFDSKQKHSRIYQVMKKISDRDKVNRTLDLLNVDSTESIRFSF